MLHRLSQAGVNLIRARTGSHWRFYGSRCDLSKERENAKRGGEGKPLRSCHSRVSLESSAVERMGGFMRVQSKIK